MPMFTVTFTDIRKIISLSVVNASVKVTF